MCDIEYTEDGCPNNCAYCEKYGLDCVYKVPQDECHMCHKKVFHNELYSYRSYEHICYECLQKVRPQEDKDLKGEENNVNTAN